VYGEQRDEEKGAIALMLKPKRDDNQVGAD
jgi:hypothetical protein